MKSIGIVFVVAYALLFGFTSCDKRPAAKFQPGDIVAVKATHEEGTVCRRTRFFRDDQYFVTLSGSSDVFLPIREREYYAAAWAAYVAKYGPPPFSSPRTSHEEGPFYESELERTH
jgi:hypothetical protein